MSLLTLCYLQILHRPEVRPAGALRPDGQGGAELQAGVRGRGRGGADHQLCHHPGPADQDQVHSEKLETQLGLARQSIIGCESVMKLKSAKMLKL